MSQLIPLLAKLKESGAERIFLAPGELGYAYTGEARRPLDAGTMNESTILQAITEVLSQDELRDLPSNRPRIVRHEHAGEGYVLEIVRQSGGVGLGIRFAAARPVRVPTFREPSADAAKVSRTAEQEPPVQKPRNTPSRRKLPAFKAEKRTIRIELDEEGNPVDSVAVDVEPGRIHSVDTKRLQKVSPGPASEPEPYGVSEAAGPTGVHASSAEQILETMLGLDSLADLPRTGWLLRGVRPCESIAEHSFGVAFLAMLFVDAIRAEGGTIDGESTLRMALVHDAAEAKTGDVPMPNKTPRMTEALHELEAKLIRDLLPPRQCAEWADVELGDSLEARLVKAADKVQMMIKAFAYERQKRGRLDDFWSNPMNFDDRGVKVARELFAALAAAAGRTLPPRVEPQGRRD